ncbi:hypothetical protein PAAL109150_10620 [Paenibacillus alkaliterrae]
MAKEILESQYIPKSEMLSGNLMEDVQRFKVIFDRSSDIVYQ